MFLLKSPAFSCQKVHITTLSHAKCVKRVCLYVIIDVSAYNTGLFMSESTIWKLKKLQVEKTEWKLNETALYLCIPSRIFGHFWLFSLWQRVFGVSDQNWLDLNKNEWDCLKCIVPSKFSDIFDCSYCNKGFFEFLIKIDKILSDIVENLKKNH